MNRHENLYNQGKTFEQNMETVERKAKGVFYTPLPIVEYMVEYALSNVKLWDNPYIKILDPACGAGYFLLKAIEVLERKFNNSISEIIAYSIELTDILQQGNIRKFIAENIIWGADIDPEAVEIAKSSINEFVGEECSLNIICCDSLTSGEVCLLDASMENTKLYQLWHQQYSYILGNPPYIGHKKVDNSYKKILHRLYKEVYRDKSDILYCFIKKSIDLLETQGVMSFICSRYFMEGPSAEYLRRYITDSCDITEIVDFQGCEVFEDAGVAACIITLKKQITDAATDITKVCKYNPREKIKQQQAENFKINREMLKSDGWLLIAPEQYELYKIIDAKGTHQLLQLMDSYQGIITGCDKAFVVTAEDIEKHSLEKELLKPWIKNKNISPNMIEPAKQYLIYADYINNEEQYPNAVRHIAQYKNKLIQRRECIKGIREWYKLQWGRQCESFDSKKIVYPYKSSSSRFAVDREGYYCSADVYSLIIKKQYAAQFSYEYIAAILNSSVMEFYFKCFAKKLSDKLYDYYPNTVLKIKIIGDIINQELLLLSEKIKKCKNKEEIYSISSAIDRELYKMYGLNERQIAILENSLK